MSISESNGTAWDDLRTLARPEARMAMRNPLIVDGRNLLDPEAVREVGFASEGIGRPASAVEERPESRPAELATALARSLTPLPAPAR